jgi:hypothetical protein
MQESLFDANGDIKSEYISQCCPHTKKYILDPEKYGLWIEACNQTFLFGNHPVYAYIALF